MKMHSLSLYIGCVIYHNYRNDCAKSVQVSLVYGAFL